MTQFSSPAVADVLAAYAMRIEEEREKAERLGPQRYARLDEFLLPIGPETGGFLHSLILAKRPARILEIGTSYGYSTIFLADAAKQVGARLITMELADYKQAHAHAMLEKAGLADVVEFRLGDAVKLISEDSGPIDFALLDIWKDLYSPCFDALYPKLADEGIIAADNMVEPENARESVRAYRAAIRAKHDLQTILLPIGSGIELSIRWQAGNAKL